MLIYFIWFVYGGEKSLLFLFFISFLTLKPVAESQLCKKLCSTVRLNLQTPFQKHLVSA